MPSQISVAHCSNPAERSRRFRIYSIDAPSQSEAVKKVQYHAIGQRWSINTRQTVTVRYNVFQEELFRSVYSRNSRSGVLFYCKQGANRSGLVGVLYAALCLHSGIEYSYRAVQALRPIVWLDHRWQNERSLLEVAWQLEPRVKALAVGLGTDRSLETVTVDAAEWDRIATDAVNRALEAQAAASLTVSDRGDGARATRARRPAQDPTEQVSLCQTSGSTVARSGFQVEDIGAAVGFRGGRTGGSGRVAR